MKIDGKRLLITVNKCLININYPVNYPVFSEAALTAENRPRFERLYHVFLSLRRPLQLFYSRRRNLQPRLQVWAFTEAAMFTCGLTTPSRTLTITNKHNN